MARVPPLEHFSITVDKTVDFHAKFLCTIYGVKICVTTDSKRAKEHIITLLNGLPSSSSSASSEADIELDIFTRAGSLQDPHLPPYVERALEPRSLFKTHRTKDKCYVVLGNSWLCLSLKNRTGIGVLEESIWSYHWIILQHFFLGGLCLLLRTCGRFLFHAAGLEHNGKGYLILGKSGAGKSTTTLSLVRHGWKYLGDDALLLHQAGSHIEAFGIPVNFKADDQTTNRLFKNINENLAIKITHDANFPYFSKRYLMIDKLYPNQFKGHSIPNFLLFTRPTSQEKSELALMRKSEALKGVIEASPHFSLDSDNVDLLSTLVRQTTAYQLLAGKDVFENPRGFEELLLNGCQ
ncbi:hypothetical protein FBQ85_06860 [Cytophagia bacterium CHB2]|nr:hypothetical protein [Cytophagia bacterium CHB2]